MKTPPVVQPDAGGLYRGAPTAKSGVASPKSWPITAIDVPNCDCRLGPTTFHRSFVPVPLSRYAPDTHTMRPWPLFQFGSPTSTSATPSPFWSPASTTAAPRFSPALPGTDRYNC